MIKFIKSASPVGYAYKEGMEAELSPAVEESLIDAGYAVAIETKIEQAVAEQPKKEKAIKRK